MTVRSVRTPTAASRARIVRPVVNYSGLAGVYQRGGTPEETAQSIIDPSRAEAWTPGVGVTPSVSSPQGAIEAVQAGPTGVSYQDKLDTWRALRAGTPLDVGDFQIPSIPSFPRSGLFQTGQPMQFQITPPSQFGAPGPGTGRTDAAGNTGFGAGYAPTDMQGRVDYQVGRMQAEANYRREEQYWEDYENWAASEIERMQALIDVAARQVGAEAASQVSAAFAPRIRALEEEIAVAKRKRAAVNSAYNQYLREIGPVYDRGLAGITAEAEGLTEIEANFGQSAENIATLDATIAGTMRGALKGVASDTALEAAMEQLGPQMDILAEMSATMEQDEKAIVTAREAASKAAIQYAGISDKQESRREQLVLDSQLKAAIEASQRQLKAVKEEQAAAALKARQDAERAFRNANQLDLPSTRSEWGQKYAMDRIMAFGDLSEGERVRLAGLFDSIMSGQGVGGDTYAILLKLQELYPSKVYGLPSSGMIESGVKFSLLADAINFLATMPQAQWNTLAGKYGWGEAQGANVPVSVDGVPAGTRPGFGGYTKPSIAQGWNQADAAYLRKAFDAYEKGYTQGSAIQAQTGPSAPSGSLGMPMPPSGGYRNTYGADRDGGTRRHKGTDINMPPGTPLYAMVSGTVTYTYGSKSGHTAVLRGDDGRTYKYMHMPRAGNSRGRVTQGQVIGSVGHSGNASSNHLHLSILNSSGQNINPYHVLRQIGYR